MPLDPSKDTAADPLVSRPGRVSRHLMWTGIAAAGVLGVGLGMWARPSDLERELAPHAAQRARPQSAAPRRIEILVDRPIPVPAEAASEAAPPQTPTPAPPAELVAPKPPAEGLVRVRAVAPERLAEAPEPRPAKAPPSAAKAPEPMAERAAQVRKAQDARAKAERQARAETARRLREEQAAAERRKIARLEQARAERKLATAAAEKKARLAAAHRAHLKVAAAKPVPKPAQKSHAKPAATRLAQAPPPKPPRAKPAPARAEGRGEGPLRKASNRCASPDPGAALVCADPQLSAAERRLARAYREAQAAGVPTSRLEGQQQRWLAARASAARQAPWAVHDVYVARIAELEDEARQATRGD